jgi:hypothetical protein
VGALLGSFVTECRFFIIERWSMSSRDSHDALRHVQYWYTVICGRVGRAIFKAFDRICLRTLNPLGP